MPDTIRHSFRSAWILGGAMVLSALVIAGAAGNFNKAGDDIQVTGSAKREVSADFVVWRLEAGGQFPTQLEATKTARDAAARVKAFLTEKGFPDSSITVASPITVVVNEFVNGNETGRINGYRVTQMVELRTSDVDKVTTLASDMSQLLDPRFPVLVNAPGYLITKLPEIRGSLTADATHDAESRATEILAAVRAKPGRIKAVRVGVVQVTKRNSTEVSDFGMYDTGSRLKEVTVAVRVTFAVK